MLSATIASNAAIAGGERALSVWRAYAQSGHAPTGTLSPIALDGFLTALLVCPKDLPVKLWILRVWGDAVPDFTDEAEHDAVTEAVIAIKDGIAANITLGRGHYRPRCIPHMGRPSLDDVRDWVAGFWKIVTLHPDWWIGLITDPKLRMTTLPFLGFIPDSDGGCMAETDENREQLFEHAGALGTAILVLDRLKKKRAASALANPARNARCPCGSGRKYKHCCA